jgi:hypothetical protein
MQNHKSNIGILIPMQIESIGYMLIAVLSIVFLVLTSYSSVFIIASIYPNLFQIPFIVNFILDTFDLFNFSDYWISILFVVIWFLFFYLILIWIGHKILDKKIWATFISTEDKNTKDNEVLVFKRKLKNVKTSVPFILIVILGILLLFGRENWKPSLWFKHTVEKYNNQDYDKALKSIEFTIRLCEYNSNSALYNEALHLEEKIYASQREELEKINEEEFKKTQEN